MNPVRSFYNDIDPFCCQWLRNLVDDGELPPGHVEQRSIMDVQAKDVEAYRQCHWFCGIGGWPIALCTAGWPADRQVWTGSCPCQPYSCAGKQKGEEDSRDLWPAFFRLICECRPDTIAGEQVAGAIGHGWLDRVQRDLEGEGYAVGHCVLGAHSVGSPHIRQRLYWIADRQLGNADGARLRARGRKVGRIGEETGEPLPSARGEAVRLADSATSRQSGRAGAGRADGKKTRYGCGMGNAASDEQQRDTKPATHWEREPLGRSGSFVYCRDGKSRRVEPGIFPLAHGLPRSVGPSSTREQRMELLAAKANRVGRLKGYGNAICPQVAAEFIRAFMELIP